MQAGTEPVEGWLYLDGMAVFNEKGFTIYPADWADCFGGSVYDRQSMKAEQRLRNGMQKDQLQPYGWTVGLDLPTLDTVRAAIETLKSEMPA